MLFVGPADLQFDLKNNPESTIGAYAKCRAAVVAAAQAAGKTAGILVRELTDLKPHLDLGFTHVAVDSDLAILRKAYQQTLSQRVR